MKDDLRHNLRIKRNYFQEYRRKTADEMIAFNFLEAFGGFDGYFIYNSFGSEADTTGIISRLLKADKRVYLPRVERNRIVAVPYGATKKGYCGIEEPLGGAYNGNIDVTVAPLLAVNARGYRLGYGGGYYDRYFAANPTLRIGLGYDFQIVDFTEDEWDERLDAFVSEKGVYRFGKE